MESKYSTNEVVFPIFEQEETSNTPKDLVFIMLKPLALANNGMALKLMERLSELGNIEQVRPRVETTRRGVETHYYDSIGRPWHPPLVHYLSGETVTQFVLRDTLPMGGRGESFADYMRREVIGPSEPEKTDERHIRNCVIQDGIDYRIEVNVPEDEIIDGRTHVLDNLVHCSDGTESALREVSNWYADSPNIVHDFADEFEQYLMMNAENNE